MAKLCAAAALLTSIPRRVTVEFVADVVCPWCYVGLKRLQEAAALASESGIAVDFEFSPFILRRHLPKSGVDKIEMFAKAGMGEAGARSKFEQIRRAAVADGLCLDFEGQRAGNSEDAHRLLVWAAERHDWLRLIEAMFEQYNCRRGWLGDSAVLAAAVERAGLPAADAAAVLADENAFGKALEAGLARSEALGTSGVPLFVVDGKTALAGAVAANELHAALQAAAARPARLAQWFVEVRNTHALPALASMFAADASMFGGSCDQAGLEDFFAQYPEVHWNVTSPYTASAENKATVVFTYTRTWRGLDGKRLAISAEEAITFDAAGKVVCIAYAKEPSEPVPLSD